jgi:predicted dithiol-disulfide oxidoreductase (DUF899 family)
MTKQIVKSREEWLAARISLLEAEKDLTRRSDAVAAQRQALPWVRVDKEYRFETDAGAAKLGELFQGRSQLMVYHLMFGPDYEAPCPSCSMIADGFNGFSIHLAHHDVMLMAVSRAPLAKLQATRKRLGWSFPWASSFGSDFNFDFNVSFTEQAQRKGSGTYNYRAQSAFKGREGDKNTFSEMCGTDTATFLRDLPGMSAFVQEDGVIYHTYSTYGRGLDVLWGAYQWLDRAPKGRNEANGVWWRRRDEYAQA